MSALAQLFFLPDVPLWVSPVLYAAGVVTAALTTALGAGGGVVLLALMAMFIPVTSVIPLHGVIQAGANGSRFLLLMRHARVPILLAFAIGGLIGAAIGSQVLIRLPEAWLQLVLGLFILWLSWIPLPAVPWHSSRVLPFLAAVTTFLSLFVGATGVLVSAFLRTLGLGRLGYVGTFAGCMLMQHGFKIAVFGFAGFVFAPWLPFLAAMLACVAIGNWLGRHVLVRIDDARFHRLLAVVLTLLAIRLLYSGIIGIIG